MVTVLSKKALEAYRAQVIFTEGFDILISMDFALGKILISVRNYLLLLWLHVLTGAKLQIHFIVGIVCHMRCCHIFCISFYTDSSSSIDASYRWTTTPCAASGSSTCAASSCTPSILRPVPNSASDLIIVVTLHIF